MTTGAAAASSGGRATSSFSDVAVVTGALRGRADGRVDGLVDGARRRLREPARAMDDESTGSMASIKYFCTTTVCSGEPWDPTGDDDDECKASNSKSSRDGSFELDGRTGK